MANFDFPFSPSPFMNSSFHPKTRLQRSRDIARLSFMLLKNIDYLELNLGEYSMREKRGHFVNTQESIRKYFDSSREVIYRLNLDKSVDLETSLELKAKRNASIFPTFRKLGYILQLCTEESFHTSLIQLVATALGNKRENITEWFLNLKTISIEEILFHDKMIAESFLAELAKIT
ncbi:hypothetical protein CDAR_87421 [Caerostris darwini]|uniref:Uncharacterized protein n=1 Tax=Caerostris darwini TaxID=1538125 RepID=A0AAV4R414_9ARAC|nr:hypothetical protein CDAR_87421 [Caerostris darwini]